MTPEDECGVRGLTHRSRADTAAGEMMQHRAARSSTGEEADLWARRQTALTHSRERSSLRCAFINISYLILTRERERTTERVEPVERVSDVDGTNTGSLRIASQVERDGRAAQTFAPWVGWIG